MIHVKIFELPEEIESYEDVLNDDTLIILAEKVDSFVDPNLGPITKVFLKYMDEESFYDETNTAEKSYKKSEEDASDAQTDKTP